MSTADIIFGCRSGAELESMRLKRTMPRGARLALADFDPTTCPDSIANYLTSNKLVATRRGKTTLTTLGRDLGKYFREHHKA
ncbi:hypothetical protein ACQX2R_04565 [Corynebacterium diphtheriae]|uniref:Uncharacterized protein n=2 Tax=Corynebacterium diphtheriae TaxID=1717 RepID=A0A811G3W3_CORDP|nr:hypothetical protein [Corynebacterium diphtheriae]OWO45825.1 hypothetical protein AY545_03325 [Corynebacterium belfantii]MBG9306639.1 hypothetical protein [Corynebacterium diphtheriae bv. mitis]MBG9316461.1 hypothetical protein [Corynebacterium diphtheriae bv. mitis]MBG9335624.1 hypothetical protein [Corynebacterium diphtheriae bv. gravis]ODS17721.1 hypothetical protein BGK43_02485 [Corynebacterium diphtheriae]